MLNWTCHVCGATRPDELISVVSTDTSAEYGLPPGTIGQNVRHCNDRPTCAEQAQTLKFQLLTHLPKTK